MLIVKKFSYCRENGIDRLRNGQLPRRFTALSQLTRACGDKSRKTFGAECKHVEESPAESASHPDGVIILLVD